MNPVDELEGFSLDDGVLNVQPDHFSVIWVDQITIRNYLITDECISRITGQLKASFTGVLQRAARIVATLENHAWNMIQQGIKAGRRLPHENICVQDFISFVANDYFLIIFSISVHTHVLRYMLDWQFYPGFLHGLVIDQIGSKIDQVAGPDGS